MSELQTGTAKRNVDEEFIENMVEAEYDRDLLMELFKFIDQRRLAKPDSFRIMVLTKFNEVKEKLNE